MHECGVRAEEREAEGGVRGLAVLGALGAGQLGHIPLSPALPSQLPQLVPLPHMGINQIFLREVSRQVKWCCSALAPVLLELSSFYFCLRALPVELRHGDPSWSAWPPQPTLWAGGSAAAALEPEPSWKVPRSPGWDQPHLASGPELLPLALASGCLRLGRWLKGPQRQPGGVRNSGTRRYRLESGSVRSCCAEQWEEQARITVALLPLYPLPRSGRP